MERHPGTDDESGREGDMHPTTEIQGMRLSSGSTVWWRDIFPTVYSIGVGIATVGMWMEWWGRPGELGAKIAVTAIWAGSSVLFALLTRALHDVWLTDDRLIVHGAKGRFEVRFEDITGFFETRGQKIKTIKIKLRPGSPLGSSVWFAPPLKLQAPFSEHPSISAIKEQKRRLAGVSSSGRLKS
jgi:hypothetical protein